MRYVNKCKLAYLLYSPFQNILLRLKGVKAEGIVYVGGGISVFKDRLTSITIGRGCRFMSKQWGNPQGLKHRCMITALSPEARLVIGNNCGFSGTSIFCQSKIVLADGVRCGANTLIMDADGHENDFRAGTPQQVTIERNVWVGSDAIILKGVTIGRWAMVGSGSVVRNSIPPYAIVIGNPAKIVGFSKTPEEIIEHEKALYPEEERLPLELLEKNYNKYFLKRLKEIKEFTRL